MVSWGAIAEAVPVATAHGFYVDTRQGRRLAIVERVVEAMIDEVLDQARVRSEQRVLVYCARNRAFAAMEEHIENQSAEIQQVLALFESDRIDFAELDKLRAKGDAEHSRVADAIAQSVLDVRAVLTPSQRKVVADYVRSELRRHDMD